MFWVESMGYGMTVYEYMRMRIAEADEMKKKFAERKDTTMYDFWIGIAGVFRQRLESLTVEELEKVI